MIKILSWLIEIIKNTFFLTGSYSNTVFLDPLSYEKEQEMVNKMLSGDKNARNILIEHNLRLVAHIVKKFENSGVDQDDLIGIGTIHLFIYLTILDLIKNKELEAIKVKYLFI